MLKWKRSVCRITKWSRHQSDSSSQKMYNYNKQRSRLSNLKEVCGSWCSRGKYWGCYIISVLPDWLILGSVKFQWGLEFNTVYKVARHSTAYLLWWNILLFSALLSLQHAQRNAHCEHNWMFELLKAKLWRDLVCSWLSFICLCICQNNFWLHWVKFYCC